MLDRLHSHDANTRVVEEMGVWSGSVRIDLAVINGELSGFEIKSDRDTLQRLPQQAELYSCVFDRVVLVVGSKHAPRAIGAVPDWWGVTIAFEQRDRIGLEPVRFGEINPSPDAYLVAKLLWKEEALAVLDFFGLARGWRSKTVDALHERLAVAVPFPDLAWHVRTTLKHRRDWLG
jgi:hypothetical protein